MCTPVCSPTPASPNTSRRSTNSVSRRSNWWSSTSTRSARRSTPAPARTSASSRSTSAGRRWCGPPRRTIPAWRSSSIRSATTVCWPRCGPAGSRSPSGRFGVLGLSAHRRIRRRGRVLDGLDAGARSPHGGLPAWFGGTWQRTAVLRYGENPHQQAALYRDDAGMAGPGAGRAAARQGDVLQQLHRRRRRLAGGVRPRADLRGDHQARQPLWHRGLVGVGRRRAPQGPRV